MRNTNFFNCDLFVFLLGVYGERSFVLLHTIIAEMNPNFFALIMLTVIAAIIMTRSNK